ncbi:MAG: flagellar biosynthetic protein FliR [Sandaracinaceae bacterium]|nr:flagellar biosynthetic protein FliR [Sandaracinaceae bacterium]
MERLYALLMLDAEPSRALAVGTLVAIRLAPLTLVAPAFAARGVPPLVRTTILLALVFGLLPTALAVSPEIPTDALALVTLGLRELALGAMFALAVSVPLYAVDHAGRVVDQLRGGGQAEISTPSGERTSLLGGALGIFAVALFAASGGHRVATLALAEGLRASPPGLASSATEWSSLALESASLLVLVLPLGLSIAAPAIVALVAADVGLAVVARSAPQLPVYFAGMPLRAWLGIAAVLLALAWIVPELIEAFDAFLHAASRLFT